MIEFEFKSDKVHDIGSVETQRQLMNRIKSFIEDNGTKQEINIKIKDRI